MLKELASFVSSVYKDVSLNPYFNGTCSKSITATLVAFTTCSVLILILMEHAQRGKISRFVVVSMKVLILILMEHAQRVLIYKSEKEMEKMS